MKLYALSLNPSCTCLDKHTYLFGFVYLHGELEKQNGYDLVSTETLEEQELEDGIYDVEVYLHDGKVKPGKLYYWKNSNNLQRGLIVNPDKEEDVKFALDNYTKKAEYL